MDPAFRVDFRQRKEAAQEEGNKLPLRTFQDANLTRTYKHAQTARNGSMLRCDWLQPTNVRGTIQSIERKEHTIPAPQVDTAP